MNIKPSDVIEAVHTYAEPEIVAVLDGLCGCGWVAAPLDALLRLSESVAKAIEAKNELAAMRAAVAAADTAADVAEAEALRVKP
jgi:hypothetical protein